MFPFFGFGSIFRFLLRNSKYTLYMGFYSNHIGDPEVQRFGWISSNIMVLIVSYYKKSAMKHVEIFVKILKTWLETLLKNDNVLRLAKRHYQVKII